MTLLFCFAPARGFAGSGPPLEAELIKTVESQNIKQGEDLLLKVDRSWTDGKCFIAQAAVLHAKVLEAGPVTGTKREQIALQPSYPCNEPSGKPLYVFALLAPQDDGVSLQLREFHSASFGQGGGLGSAGNSQGNHVDLSGRQNPTLPITTGRDESQVAKRPTSLRAGEAWKLKKLDLKLGAGPEQSTIIESTSGHLKLMKGTVLVLTIAEPRLHATDVAPDTSVTIAQPVAKKVSSPPVPSLSACRPPRCSTFAAVQPTASSIRPVVTFSLKGIGYNRTKQVEMLNAGYDAAVAFLGNDRVLFTFNSRALVHRRSSPLAEDMPRGVRAVVFSLSSQGREDSVTWEVPDHNQYLWQLPGGRVLVHNGEQLQILDSNLKVERTLALADPLVYVRVAPDGQHIAVGTLGEIHSAEEHQRLSSATKSLPEERVQVRLYDAAFNKLDEVSESSRSTRPVLLNDGYAQLRMSHEGEFYLRFQDYGRASYRDFARMKSECVPELSTFSANLILAETCESQKLSDSIEVFREDGSPVLHTSVDWRTLSPSTAGTENGNVFALATMHVGGDYVRGSVFHANDIASESVTVQDVRNGQKLLDLSFSAPNPSMQPVALSLAGSRIAVFTGEKIEVYAVPAAKTTP